MRLPLLATATILVILLASAVGGPLFGMPSAVLAAPVAWFSIPARSKTLRLAGSLLSLGLAALAVVGLELARVGLYQTRGASIIAQLTNAEDKQHAFERAERRLLPGMTLMNHDDTEFEVHFSDRFDMTDFWQLSSKRPGWTAD
jgi:hypothetical protein